MRVALDYIYNLILTTLKQTLKLYEHLDPERPNPKSQFIRSLEMSMKCNYSQKHVDQTGTKTTGLSARKRGDPVDDQTLALQSGRVPDR